MNDEMMYLWRNKLSSLKHEIPGYEGSAAEQMNEISWQVMEYQHIREKAAAAEAEPEPATVINVIGGYKKK